MRLLVTEDDPKIASFLAKGFQESGFAVDQTDSGEDALVMAMTSDYDAAIVDLMLPGLDGLSLIERMREENITFPIIVLSAKRALEDRVTCLQKGADDYVGKPFAFSELLARLQAVMRRARGTAEPTKLEVGDIALDRLSREVTRAGRRIDLQPREFALLENLMRNVGKVLSKSFLLERLWDYNFDPQTNVVDVLVCRLRNKVDKEFPCKMIHTLRGVGYVFERIKQLSRTVGIRIALWHSLTFVAGTLLVFVSAYYLLKHSVEEQSRETIEFRLNQFSREYERGGLDAILEFSGKRRGRAQRASFVRLGNAKNETLFLRDAEDWAEFHPERLAGQPIVAGVHWTDTPGLEGSVLRLASMKLEDGSILQVGKTTEVNQELLAQFRIALVAIAGIVILAGAAGGTWAAFRTLRPVHQLTATVRSILDTGKFTARVPTRGSGDEIDELVQCFNAMLGKIDLLFRGMRDSLDNVAHDLRTPMTRLRNIASKAIEQGYDRTAAHEALADCLEESERVVSMLATLMDISEAETGVMKLDRRPVNAASLVHQVVDLYEHVAEEKRITLSVEVPAELQISGDAGRLQRALGNLLDNAIKYTPEQGRVTIRASRRPGGIAIEVADTGDGISKDELTRIWERLYRVDKSRSQRGLGLGLSFVKAIIEAHGGKVSVETAAGKGSRFIMELPASSLNREPALAVV